MHIHQDIDFYIVKDGLYRKTEKTRQVEKPAIESQRKDTNYENLKQENQFLKEKLNQVLQELEVYRKTVTATSPEMKVKTERHRPTNITSSMNSGLKFKTTVDIDVKKSLSKTHSNKHPVGIDVRENSRTRLATSKNLSKNNSVMNSTGYLSIEKTYKTEVRRQSSRAETDPLIAFLQTIDKHKAVMPKKSIKEPVKRDFSPAFKKAILSIGKVASY